MYYCFKNVVLVFSTVINCHVKSRRSNFQVFKNTNFAFEVTFVRLKIKG